MILSSIINRNLNKNYFFDSHNYTSYLIIIENFIVITKKILNDGLYRNFRRNN